MRTESDRDRFVQVFVNRNGAPRQRAAEFRLVDLPSLTPDRYRIVLGYHALGLHTEDPVQVAPVRAPKRRAFLRRRNRKSTVELSDVPLPQERIGAIYRTDPSQP